MQDIRELPAFEKLMGKEGTERRTKVVIEPG